MRGLLAGGATGDEKPFEALGYKQAVMHLRGEITLAQAVESTIIETRQYAKRQRTWFRRDAEIKWLAGFGDEADCLKLELDAIPAARSLPADIPDGEFMG